MKWRNSLTISLFTFTIYLMKMGKTLMPKMKIRMKQFGKLNWIFEFFISKLGYVTIFIEIWDEKIWPIFKTFLTNWGKNENVNGKFWGNYFDLWILHIKIRFHGNFHENLRKCFLIQFLSHFWLIEAKIKTRMKKYWKMSSIFEFSISKLGYMAILM